MIDTSDRRAVPGSSISAGAFLCLLAFLLGLTGWLFTSARVSFVDPDRDTVDYVLVARPSSQLVMWYLGALGLLGLSLAVAVRRWFQLRRWQDTFAWPVVGSLAPILILVLPLVAIGMLATPLARAAPPWIYLFVDLRWWLLAATIALLAGAAAERSGRTIGPRARIMPAPLVWELLTAATLLAAALAFSPKDRFDPAVVGDEPKYIRYLENWYRGRGTDIDNLVPIQKLPVDYQPQVLRNVGHAVEALSIIVTDLFSDARRLAGLPAPPRPGPASSHGDAFIKGQHGGVYQVHNPGLSLLLFPGYFLDRFVLTWSSHSFAQGPAHLYATNVVMLSMYLLWGLALFRLLSSHTSDPALSFAVACIALLSLPATAFAYQYYPEVAGGLLLVVVTRYVSHADRYGILAGVRIWSARGISPVAARAIRLRRDRGWNADDGGKDAVGASDRRRILDRPCATHRCALPVQLLPHREPSSIQSLGGDARGGAGNARDQSRRCSTPRRPLAGCRLGAGRTCPGVPAGTCRDVAVVGAQPPADDARGASRAAARDAVSGVQLAWERHGTAADRDRGRAAARDSAGRRRAALPALAVVPRCVRSARRHLHQQRVVVQQPIRPRPAGTRGTDDWRVAEPAGLPASRHA